MKRWQYWLLAILNNYSVIVSSTVLRLDLKKRQLKKESFWISLYVTLSTLSLVVALPLAIPSNFAHGQLYETNVVAKYANFILLAVRSVIIITYVLTRSYRDKCLREWLECLMAIHTAYLDRCKDIPKDIRCRKWIYCNCALTWIHCLPLTVEMLEAQLNRRYDRLADMFLVCGMISVHHINMLHHALLLCYIQECLSIVKQQLRENLVDPKLSLIYFQLRNLYRQLNELYGPMILWIQIGLILSNSMVGYIGFRMLLISSKNSGQYGYLFGNSLYLCVLAHMYIYFNICNWVEAMISELDIILYGYKPRDISEAEEIQEIEKIVFSRSLFTPAIRICGMFDINFKTLFSIVSQTILYTILLMQVDYGKIK
uniref:Gustatory receptor n=1 Tax=Stomoxys calcitrans TaxID=35570 RepID=A0A2Y9D4L2_STOCA